MSESETDTEAAQLEAYKDGFRRAVIAILQRIGRETLPRVMQHINGAEEPTLVYMISTGFVAEDAIDDMFADLVNVLLELVESRQAEEEVEVPE